MARPKKAGGLRRMYECDECHARRYVKRVELIRAAKPRCDKCGCTRLEPVTDEAVDELAVANDAKREFIAKLDAQSSK